MSVPPPGHIHIPTHSSAPSPLRCCCGRPECEHLAGSMRSVRAVERDLETAARLGQALLHRHESYVAEAEDDRRRLHGDIEALQRQNRQVEAENARIVEENRTLLERLEGLNRTIAESDASSKNLTATLESTEAELRKLTASANRAADLERQLSQLEAEQSSMQDSLFSAREDNKAAVQRWKKAEQTIQGLQDQVENIEKEHREERERHSEMVQRMERRRVVERELDGAAGRLKGAAAAQELGRNTGTNVVSKFVRDILQDNANLQMGIMELREMLESSNQEVQNLRDQVLTHEPISASGEDGTDHTPSTTLSQELASSEARISQELHIHHHYHSPSASFGSKKDKTPVRRNKQRRSLHSPAALHSATPLSRKSLHHYNPSTASSTSTILSQTSVSIPPGGASRQWSSQSLAIDSLASSPQSGRRTSSIFDRVDRGFEFSQPTSPDSTVFSSPLLGNRRKNPADGLDQPNNDELLNLDYDGEINDSLIEPVIPEESEDSSVQYAESECGLPHDDVFISYQSMHKCPSHDSLFSVAGMDIHTPSNRPSRMSRLHPTVPVRFPRRMASPSVDLSSTLPVISATNVMANRESAKAELSPKSLLASVSGAPPQPAPAPVPAENKSTLPQRKISLSRRVGSWMLGRWGNGNGNGTGNPTESDENKSSETESEQQAKTESTDTSATSTPSPSRPSSSSGKRPSSSSGKRKSDTGLSFRYPGVSHFGSGPGSGAGTKSSSRTPSAVHAEGLDEGLLRESLAE